MAKEPGVLIRRNNPSIDKKNLEIIVAIKSITIGLEGKVTANVIFDLNTAEIIDDIATMRSSLAKYDVFIPFKKDSYQIGMGEIVENTFVFEMSETGTEPNVKVALGDGRLAFSFLEPKVGPGAG